ncbi:MAG: type III pantothenate kinase [Saprospiraceae bacterium]|nr:type III pantothenate kinase [Saprospiraceae bacterium]
MSQSCRSKNHYGTPESLGKDRLAAAAGAFARIPGQQTLIIDMGTCITMNFTASGDFTGGNISQGIRMRLKAMHKFTAKLPLVDPLLHNKYFATTTVKALQNGAVKAHLEKLTRL